jgi:hypothetical protein
MKKYLSGVLETSLPNLNDATTWPVAEFGAALVSKLTYGIHVRPAIRVGVINVQLNGGFQDQWNYHWD